MEQSKAELNALVAVGFGEWVEVASTYDCGHSSRAFALWETASEKGSNPTRQTSENRSEAGDIT